MLLTASPANKPPASAATNQAVVQQVVDRRHRRVRRRVHRHCRVCSPCESLNSVSPRRGPIGGGYVWPPLPARPFAPADDDLSSPMNMPACKLSVWNTSNSATPTPIIGSFGISLSHLLLISFLLSHSLPLSPSLSPLFPHPSLVCYLPRNICRIR